METAVNMVLGEVCLSEIFLNTILEISEDIDIERNVPVRHMVSGVRAAAWIGKGLAMRGHNGISVVASVLLRLLLSEAFEVCHCGPFFTNLITLYRSNFYQRFIIYSFFGLISVVKF